MTHRSPGRSPVQREARYRSRVVLLACLVPVVVFNLTASRLWIPAFRGDPPKGVDYIVFYVGGKLLFEDPARLYDLERQKEIQDEVLDYRIGWMRFAYHPAVGLFFAPFAAGNSFGRAYAQTLVAEIALAILCIALLARGVRCAAESAAWIAISALWSVPFYQTIYSGQASFLILLAFMLHVFARGKRADLIAGIGAGLLLLKPTMLPIPLIALAVAGRWRALAAAGVTIAVLVGTSTFAIGPSFLPDWLGAMRATGEVHIGDPTWMFNLRMLTHVVLPSAIARPVWMILTVVTVAGAAVLHRRPAADARESAWRWTATVLAMLLASPHLCRHDLVLLLVPAALHLRATGTEGATIPLRFAAILLLACLATGLPTVPTSILLLLALIGAAIRAARAPRLALVANP